jgi:Putative phage serine protease XkdF
MGLTLTDSEFDFFSQWIDENSVRKGKNIFSTLHTISKAVDEKQQVFGWASVGYLPDGKLYTDWQGDELSQIEDIEKAAYDFTLHSRDSGLDHTGDGGIGTLIESFVSTPEKTRAMKIPDGILPIGWWTGFHVNNANAWDGVKKGRYKMFSIQGNGRRVPIL